MAAQHLGQREKSEKMQMDGAELPKLWQFGAVFPLANLEVKQRLAWLLKELCLMEADVYEVLS